MATGNATRYKVLILVLLELSLWDYNFKVCYIMADVVLILVLLELSLWEI